MPTFTKLTSPLRLALAQRLPATQPQLRAFTTTPNILSAKPAPSKDHQPPSGKKAGRTTHVADDQQSSASQHEHKTGDDHPAKQPDNQEPSSRSTPFDNTKEVKGGKEGLDARTDKK